MSQNKKFAKLDFVFQENKMTRHPLDILTSKEDNSKDKHLKRYRAKVHGCMSISFYNHQRLLLLTKSQDERKQRHRIHVIKEDNEDDKILLEKNNKTRKLERRTQMVYFDD